MPNAPHNGGDFDAFGDPRRIDAKSRDMPLQDDRVPGPDVSQGRIDIPLTPLDELGIIRDINKIGREKIGRVGIPAYAPDPYEQPPGGPTPPFEYEAHS